MQRSQIDGRAVNVRECLSRLQGERSVRNGSNECPELRRTRPALCPGYTRERPRKGEPASSSRSTDHCDAPSRTPRRIGSQRPTGQTVTGRKADSTTANWPCASTVVSHAEIADAGKRRIWQCEIIASTRGDRAVIVKDGYTRLPKSRQRPQRTESKYGQKESC